MKVYIRFLVGVLISVMFIGVISTPLVVKADTVTIPNDGNAKTNPYGDSGIPKSYEGEMDYYDCYIPYNLTLEEIGGWANGSYDDKKGGAYSWDMEHDYPARKKWLCAQHTNREMSDGVGSPATYCNTVTCDRVEESTNMCVYKDSNGNNYYGIALPFFCWNFGGLATNTDPFCEWGVKSNGQLFDLILTDGTVIHCFVHDHKGIAHTNWGQGGVSPENPDVRYNYAPIVYEQYADIFQAAAGETLELWGTSNCTTKFESAFGLGSGDNHVAIIRMYMFNLKNGVPIRTEEAGQSTFHSAGANVTILPGDDVVSPTPEDGEGLGAISYMVTEWELAGMPKRSDFAEYQKVLNLPIRDDLSTMNSVALQSLKSDVELKKSVSLVDFIRTAIIFIGLVLLLYGSLLFLAVVFDKANTFIDFSFVHLLTFGKIFYNLGEVENAPKNFYTTRKLFFVVCIVLAVGFFLVSGGANQYLGKFIHWVSKKF